MSVSAPGDDSKIDDTDSKNTSAIEARHAMDEQSAGHNPNGSDSLTSRRNALTGQHGLDQNLARMLLAIIKIIMG